MTKVTLRYDLTRPLTEEDLLNIAATHSTYGLTKVMPADGKLTVDYDASRLMKQDVEAVLARHGIPVRV